MDKNEVVLLLGSVNREGATMALKATKKFYKHKLLDSSLHNWGEIIRAFDEYKITSVIAKITRNTLFLAASNQYKNSAIELFSLISRTPHIVFCHESMMTGQVRDEEISTPTINKYDQKIAKLNPNSPSYFDDLMELEEKRHKEEDRLNHIEEHNSLFYESYFSPPPDDIRLGALNLIYGCGVSITPYQKNFELSLLSSSFIEDQEHNLIFRMYIPASKLWSGEAEKIIQLFRDYLQRVSELDIRQDQRRTSQGIVYEFFGNGKLELQQLPEKFKEFTGFMESCVANPEAAKLVLETKNLNKLEVMNILERYSKEARRIHVDLKHERERAIMKIRHELESELIDHVREADEWATIAQLINNSVPGTEGARLSTAFTGAAAVGRPTNYTINLRPQIIERVNGIVAGTINGDQHLTERDKELLKLIGKFGERDTTQLSACVHEISDPQIESSRKVEAKSKLLSFIFKVTDKIGDVAAGVLKSYLEKQVGL